MTAATKERNGSGNGRRNGSEIGKRSGSGREGSERVKNERKMEKGVKAETEKGMEVEDAEAK